MVCGLEIETAKRAFHEATSTSPMHICYPFGLTGHSVTIPEHTAVLLLGYCPCERPEFYGLTREWSHVSVNGSAKSEK